MSFMWVTHHVYVPSGEAQSENGISGPRGRYAVWVWFLDCEPRVWAWGGGASRVWSKTRSGCCGSASVVQAIQLQ